MSSPQATALRHRTRLGYGATVVMSLEERQLRAARRFGRIGLALTLLWMIAIPAITLLAPTRFLAVLLTLYAAAPQAYTRFPYPVEWASSIWADIDEIPFDRMQVLELPEPAGRPAVAPVLNRCTQDAVHGRGPGPSTRGADPDD